VERCQALRKAKDKAFERLLADVEKLRGELTALEIPMSFEDDDFYRFLKNQVSLAQQPPDEAAEQSEYLELMEVLRERSESGRQLDSPPSSREADCFKKYL
jgi:hypothetical protein